MNSPSVPKSGVSNSLSGQAGTLRFHPCGLTVPSAPTNGPILPTASTMIARIVVTTIERKIAPRTFSTHSTMTRARPKQNTSTGQPSRLPEGPRVTGTGPTWVRRTKPASTKPIRAMKRPMPTEMATLSSDGTAWNTASRNPVSTRTRITTPSMTTRPIASAQVIWVAMATATKALRPRPVARASG